MLFEASDTMLVTDTRYTSFAFLMIRREMRDAWRALRRAAGADPLTDDAGRAYLLLAALAGSREAALVTGT